MPVSPPIVIAGDFAGYPLSSFHVPAYYEQYLSSVLIPKGMIEDRTRKLAELIHTALGDKPLVALCVLKGAFRFYNSLIDHLLELRRSKNGKHTESYPIYYDFIRLKSYTDDNSTGNVEVIGANPLAQLNDKHVLIVEDIVDTGLTMKKMVTLLDQHKPASISMVTLLTKRTNRCTEDTKSFQPDYVGFEIPDRFVVGYGLDYNEAFRDLNHICDINKAGIEKFKEK